MPTASSGTTAVTINTGNATDKVYINNLQITGAGAANSTGISVTNGQLVLSHSAVKFLTTGVSVNSTKADLYYVDLIGNGTAISTTGTGTDQNASVPNGPTQVRVSWGSVFDNTTAFLTNNPGLGCSGNCANLTIYEFITSNTSAAWSTVLTGNATVATGTGASCTISGNPACTNVGTFEQLANPH